MKYIHNLKIRANFKENDLAPDQFVQSCLTLLGIDTEDESTSKKIEVEIEEITHKQFDTIFVVEIYFKNTSLANKIALKILSNLSKPDRETLTEDLHLRIDERFNFFFKLSKQKLLEKKYVLAIEGSSVQVKMNLATYPNKMEVATKIVNDICRASTELGQ